MERGCSGLIYDAIPAVVLSAVFPFFFPKSSTLISETGSALGWSVELKRTFDLATQAFVVRQNSSCWWSSTTLPRLAKSKIALRIAVISYLKITESFAIWKEIAFQMSQLRLSRTLGVNWVRSGNFKIWNFQVKSFAERISMEKLAKMILNLRISRKFSSSRIESLEHFTRHFTEMNSQNALNFSDWDDCRVFKPIQLPQIAQQIKPMKNVQFKNFLS